MRTSTFVPLVALLGLALSVPALVPRAQADGRTNRPDILPVDKLEKGMKGYGLTVFEGTKPERFDVEVIDVLEDFRPHQELILIKTIHPRLDVVKIVAGMSGSPIFIDGRMVGAYSYGWTFGVEPVAGVTPIRNMLDDLERPIPGHLRGAPIKVFPEQKATPLAARQRRARHETERYDVLAHASALSRASGRTDSQLAPVSTPLMLGGFSESAVAAAKTLLEPLGLTPLQAGGTSAPRRQGKEGASSGRSPRGGGGFVDGGAIGVTLVSGDVSAMGLGTVTRVEGDRLVAFGHPMMGVGVTSLPTAEAKVLWFMASQMRSFKMGQAIAARGTLVNDRQASIVVHQDAEPHTVPVRLRVRGEPGAPYTDWRFDLAHDQFVTPAMLAMAVGSALESAAAERRDVTYSLRTRVKFVGYPEMTLEDFGSAPTGTPGASEVMQSDIVKSIGAAFNNPWQHAVLESVSVDAELKFSRDVAILRGVELLTPEVEPGEPVRIRLVMEPYAGARQTRTLSLPLPASLAGRSVGIEIRPGYEVERERPEPESLAELMVNLENATERPRSVVLSYETGLGGAAHHGVVARGLPPFALDRLMSKHSSLNVSQFKAEAHHVTDLPYYLVGKDSVTVQVRSQSD